jgi:PAS domain S-box-containing protein
MEQLSPIPAVPREPDRHWVQFYATDDALSDVVTRFIADGLETGEPAVIIATASHRDAIVRRFRERGIAAEQLVDEGALVMLDAHETLAAFMIDGLPRRERFRGAIGRVLDKLAAAHPNRSIRAYGEMVDVLWRSGQQDAALRLEGLWNDLRAEYDFGLLCAYALDSFYPDDGVPRICATHSHVLPPEQPVRIEDPSTVASTVQSLIAEIARRTELERALRDSLRRAHDAEEAAHAARADLEEFLSNAVIAIHRVDRNGIIRWANQAELDMLGYTAEEYIGRHISEFHADRAAIEDMLARLTRGETLRDYEARMRTKSGDIRVVEVSSNVHRKNGEFDTTRCFSRDVTAARRSERRGAVLHRLATDLSRALSAEEAARVVIREARDVVGAPAGGVLLLDPTSTTIDRMFIDGDQARAVAANVAPPPLDADLPLCEAARTGKPVWITGADAIEKRYPHLASLRSDVAALAWGAIPITFEGRTLGAIGFRCCDERALTSDDEALLLAIGRQCGQAIERARLFDAAQVARAEAEQASRAKDEFLAILGHELRNPLSPILTAVQLMRLRGDQESLREQNIIERQVNHLIHIVDDLLDISRVARGKIQLDKRPLRLRALITKAVEITRPLFEEREQRLDVVAADDNIYVEADETRLCQVLTNLLSNAAKYTPRLGHITVELARTGSRVAIRVKDDGCGIAPDLIPRIFDLFVQGNRASDRKQGGLGIGLALVRNLVQMHGGTVTAHSAGLGRGSEFVVELPVIDVARTVPRAGDSEWGIRRRVAMTTRKILVVDDNEDAGQLLGEMLRSVGHDVVVALDGPRALEAVKTFCPDVAILDIGLPVMDGYELASMLRGQLGNDVRMLAVTGYGQEQDKQRALRAGFEQHFVKPVSLQKVLAAIEVGRPLPDAASRKID